MEEVDEKVIREYLLGTLSETAMQQFEQLYLDDLTVFEDLQGVEQELIDEYAKGRLNSDETERFEAFFLKSENRKTQLQLSNALMQMAAEETITTVRNLRSFNSSPSQIRQGRWFAIPSTQTQRLLLAACLVIGLGALGLTVYRDRQVRQQLAEARREVAEQREQTSRFRDLTVEQQNRQTTLNAQLEEQRENQNKLEEEASQTGSESIPNHNDNGPGQIASVVDRQLVVQLIPIVAGRDGSSGEGKKQITKIPAGKTDAVFRISIERTGFQRYAAKLVSAENKPVWQGSARLIGETKDASEENQTGTVQVRLPSKVFSNGTYKLIVTGITPDNSSESIGATRVVVDRK